MWKLTTEELNILKQKLADAEALSQQLHEEAVTGVCTFYSLTMDDILTNFDGLLEEVTKFLPMLDKMSKDA